MDKTVLIVDDDNLTRKSLSQTLAGRGLIVEEAEDGASGLDRALSLRPDLVVSDIRMPGQDGLTMVEKLRQDEWGRQVPVIFLTTDDNTATVNQALSLGVTTYLSKTSLSPDEIADHVAEALGS